MEPTHIRPVLTRAVGTVRNIYDTVESARKIEVETMSKKDWQQFNDSYDFLNSFGPMLNDQVTSDVILSTNNTSFYVHKAILAARSDYFRALLYGGLSESRQDSIELLDTPAEAFQVLLDYIYTSRVDFQSQKLSTLLDLFSLAHRYQLEKLQNSLQQFFQISLDIENFPQLLSLAMHYDLNQLVIDCCIFVHACAEKIFSSEAFGHLSSRALELLFALEKVRDAVWEATLVNALITWNRAHPYEHLELANALAAVGMSMATVNGKASIVKPMGTLTDVCSYVPEMSTSTTEKSDVCTECSGCSCKSRPVTTQKSMKNAQESTEARRSTGAIFKCWFEDCNYSDNQFLDTGSRNAHFNEHFTKYIREEAPKVLEKENREAKRKKIAKNFLVPNSLFE